MRAHERLGLGLTELLGSEQVVEAVDDLLEGDEFRVLLGVRSGLGHALEPDAGTEIDVGLALVDLAHREERERREIDVVLVGAVVQPLVEQAVEDRTRDSTLHTRTPWEEITHPLRPRSTAPASRQLRPISRRLASASSFLDGPRRTAGYGRSATPGAGGPWRCLQEFTDESRTDDQEAASLLPRETASDLHFHL
jgi:hypothetical protein